MNEFIVAAFIALTLFHIFPALAGWVHVRVLYPKRQGRAHFVHSRFTVSVLVPCKGTDRYLEENLCAISDQWYNDYTVTYITESEGDPAVATIARVMRTRPHTRHLVAGLSDGCAQKNHNLLRGLDSDSRAEIFVVCDADVRPDPHWLSQLVRPFALGETVVVTGYRWISPREQQLSTRLHTLLCGYLTALMGVSALASVWGGGMAIRREAVEGLGIRKLWQDTISDDLPLQRVLLRHRLQRVFVPECVCLSPAALPSLRQLIEWFSRQSFYAKLYFRPWWVLSLIIETLIALAVLISPVMWLGAALGSPVLLIPALAAAGFFAAVMISGALVKLPYAHKTDFPLVWWALLMPVAQLVGTISLWRALFMRSVTWSRITYRFNRDGTVKSISRSSEAVTSVGRRS